MKRFKFRFEAVEKLRKIEMEKQARIYALAEVEVARIRNEISNLEERGRAEVVRMSKEVDAGNWTRQLQELSVQFRQEMRRQIVRQSDKLKLAMKKAEEERLKLVSRQTDRKAIEKLKEKEEEAYYEELRKSEIKEMDEVSSSRWINSHR